MTKTIEPGIYDMKDEQYFSSPGISNSALSQFARSPAHYKESLKTPWETTPAKEKGKALHCLILEPEVFDENYFTLPADAPARPSKAVYNAKNPSEASMDKMELWATFDAQANGRTIFTADQTAAYKETAKHIRNHAELKNLLANGLAEKAVFGKDPVTGLLCRCKVDYLAEINGRIIIVDLKTSADARPNAFQRSAYNYGYFRQAAFYLDVCRWAGIEVQEPFIIACFEPDPPHGLKLFECSGETILRGRGSYRPLLNRMAECMEKDEWPGYDTDITPLLYPSWAQD